MEKIEALKIIDDIQKFCAEGISDDMDWDGVSERYKKLPEIAQKFPELTNNVLSTYKTSLQSDNVGSWEVMYIFDGLRQILNDKPELCDECFDLYKLFIKSNKQLNDLDQYKPCSALLNNIMEMKPDIANDVVDFYAVVLKSEGLKWNDVYNIIGYNLSNLLKGTPSVADRILDILEEYLQSGILDKQYGDWSHDKNPLQMIYEILGNVTVLKPELIDKVSKVYKIALSLERSNISFGANGYETIYDSLSYIIENRAELSDKVFDIFEIAMLSDKNNSDTLEKAYNNLGYICGEKPELSDKILELLKKGIESCENDSETLKRIYANLEKIIQAKPETADEGLNLFKMALESEANNGKRREYFGTSSLGFAYEKLGNILQLHPELSDKIFEILKFCSELKENNEDSFQAVYETLGKMLQNESVPSDKVIDTLKVLLQSERLNHLQVKERVYTHAFITLGKALSARPEAAGKLFELYEKMISKSESYNALLAGIFQIGLHDIIKNQPEYIDNVLNIIKTTSDKFDNDITSTYSKYKSIYTPLNDIIEAHPEYREKALGLYSGSYSSYEVLGYVETDISLADKILEKLTTDLQSGKEINVSPIYEILKKIVYSHPELADKVFEVIKIGLNSNMSERYSFLRAYKALSSIQKSYPEQSDKVLESLEIGLKSSKNGYYEIREAYDILKDIIKYQPQYADKAFEVFKVKVQSNNAEENSYNFLKNIIISQPQYTDKAFDLFELAIKNPPIEKGGINVCETHEQKIHNALQEVYKAKPEFTNRIVDTYKTLLVSDKNIHPVSTENIIKELGNIVKNNPDLYGKALDIILLSLENPAKYSDLYKKAYEVSTDILKLIQKPSEKDVEICNKILLSLNAEVYLESQSSLRGNFDLPTAIFKNLKDIISLNPQLADSAIDTLNTFINSDCFTKLYPDGSERKLIVSNEYRAFLGHIPTLRPDLSGKILDMAVYCDNIPADLNIYKACMKHLPAEETIAKYPEIEQDLRLAHKGRYATNEEMKYALEHFSKEKLTESMIFSAQQRVMNVLVSTSAQESGISKEEASAFRKPDAPEAVKNYMTNNNDWLIPASFKGAAIFKEYFPAYIKTIQNHNQKNPENKLSVHDTVYWLPEPMNSEANERFSLFIQKNIIYQNAEHKMVHRPLEELKIIAQNWKGLENKLQNQGENSDINKLKYNDVLSICMSIRYQDQRNDLFAVEAAKHYTPEAEYHNCEDIYLAGLKVPEPFDSKKEFKEGKYIGRFLPRKDPRTIFFGDYTNCCQHYGGVGNSCAISTVKHPFSQLFVIEDDNGKIIAGSWTWENTEGKYREVCFDNIESLGELSERPELNKIYEQVGKYLTEEQNCRRVTIGLGYQDADVSGYEKTEAIALPKLYGNDNYSDARSQVLLTENPDAEPLDKTQESQRYIRDVCFLDMEAMDKVSYAVFPDGDKQLQAPDNMAGFVIEDREKGVVGYCLYDTEEKSIYDMAVLPEYRTDKNASSKKLFAEMMRTIRQEGGQWSAEMRDKTTLKYLEIMAARGLVKFEKHGVDHTMSDGSQVIAVTFEPIRDDVRQATNKLKGKVEENVTAKIVDIKSNSATSKHGVSIIKDSDAREA